MSSISEEKFNRLLQRTIRIDLIDGTVLLYQLTQEQNEDAIIGLRENSSGSELEKTGATFMIFRIYQNRLVFVNKDFILRIVFCTDLPTGDSWIPYLDNFNVLEPNEKTEDNYAIQPEGDDELLPLPQAIIKLTNKLDYEGSDILSYSALDDGDLYGLNLEVMEISEPLREFVELKDDDGEYNFIPMKQIICMEVDSNIVDIDEDFDEEEES